MKVAALRDRTHPIIKMTPQRTYMWANEATHEDFYQHIHELAAIYAKLHYTGDGKLDDHLLFKDYKQWKDAGNGDKMVMSPPARG